MTAGRAALLLGLFAVPGVLLWAGHRLRRRSARWRAAFWGALVAHVVAMGVATVAALVPPEEWRPDDVWRGVLGFWLLLVGPALGALVGGALGGRPEGAPDREGRRRSTP